MSIHVVSINYVWLIIHIHWSLSILRSPLSSSQKCYSIVRGLSFTGWCVELEAEVMRSGV